MLSTVAFADSVDIGSGGRRHGDERRQAGTSEWPRWISDLGIAVIAYLLVRTVTQAMALQMLAELPWMAAAAVAWV